jgi:hypothetical protein
MEQWRVINIVMNSGVLQGYDVLSSTGKSFTVTSEQLRSATSRGFLLNTYINDDNNLVIKGHVSTRNIYTPEKTYSIQVSESELKALQPHIHHLYGQLLARGKRKDQKAIDTLGRLMKEGA